MRDGEREREALHESLVSLRENVSNFFSGLSFLTSDASSSSSASPGAVAASPDAATTSEVAAAATLEERTSEAALTEDDDEANNNFWYNRVVSLFPFSHKADPVENKHDDGNAFTPPPHPIFLKESPNPGKQKAPPGQGLH